MARSECVLTVCAKLKLAAAVEKLSCKRSHSSRTFCEEAGLSGYCGLRIMLLEAIAGTAAGVTLLGAAGLVAARRRRAHIYAGLQAELMRLPHASASWFEPAFMAADVSFARRLAVVPQVFSPVRLEMMRNEALGLFSAERNYIPAHKKGGTIAYETLIAHAPLIAGLYHSPLFIEAVSRIIGERLVATPLHDQSSLSLLWYDRPGDHIGWHYDHNFYLGRHFTLLIPLINEGAGEDGLSHAQLVAKIGDEERLIATPPNRMVLFEGAKIHHKVTPVLAGERRLVLSMTYCTDPRAHWWQGTARRVKDTAFFGVRALWT